MHLSVHTRPDISFSVTLLSTKLTTANKLDIQAALHIVRYLAGTRDLGLIFSSEATEKLFTYIDASYLTHSDAKSHSGMTYRLGCNTGSFFSRSQKQKLVTRSSAESELCALDKVVCDIQWLRLMLKFLGSNQCGPTVVYEDNKSTMLLASGNAKMREVSRHLNMRYCYVKESISAGEIILEYVNTKDQIADILTKNISCTKEFLRLRKLLLNDDV